MDVVGEQYMEAYCLKHTADYIELFRDFEMKKRKKTAVPQSKVTMKIPASFTADSRQPKAINHHKYSHSPSAGSQRTFARKSMGKARAATFPRPQQPAALPEARQKTYNPQRNSRVLLLKIS